MVQGGISCSGDFVCPVFNSGKTVFGRAPEKCSGGVWQSLYADSGIDQLGIFALEKPGEILAYLQAMFGLNGVGLMNTQAMFLGNEYLVLLIIALVACLPVGQSADTQTQKQQDRTSHGIIPRR